MCMVIYDHCGLEPKNFVLLLNRLMLTVFAAAVIITQSFGKGPTVYIVNNLTYF